MGKRSHQEENERLTKRRRSAVTADQGNGHVDDNEETVPLAGIIKRVELKNFMNHASLAFDFQPRVNFVTGRNGTGKSALLTGLIVGLGGKAAATNRGNQLSGFIQDGKNIADTKVSLRNEGADAFQPDVYGDTIIVERKLSRAGGGEYKIKTSTGKVISTKKADLMRILDNFNIQVENPVCVLNQETSKNFLCSKNPADVYKFFVKATQLEQMQLGYSAANKEFKTSMTTLKSKELVLPAMELELKQAQEKATALESLDKLRNTLESKQCELAWATVARKESEYEVMRQRVVKLEKSLPKFEASVAKSEKKIADAKQKKKDIEDRIKDMAGDTEALEPQKNELKKQLIAKRQRSRINSEAVKQVQQELKHSEKEKKCMEDRVKDIQASSQNDHSALIKERDEKLLKYTERLQELEKSCANTKAEMSSTLRTITTLREEKNEHASSVGECERLKRMHQEKKIQLEKTRNNKSVRFGRNMPALIDEVERMYKAGRFTKKPIGPLGAHINVRDMRYALGAERALGAMMSAFYVNHKSDAILLDQVKKRICAGEKLPEVYTGTFTEHRYDGVDRNRAQTTHHTLMDMLDIDNNCVFNCLVDQLSIHNIVMVLNSEEAQDLMFNNQPRNSHVCYDEKGDEIRAKPDRVFANRSTRPNFLSANVEEDIRVEATKLRDVCATLSEAKDKLDQVSLQIQSNHEKHVKLKTTAGTIERQIRKVQSSIEEINSQVIEASSADDADALLSDVTNLEREIEQLRLNLESAREKYDIGKREEDEVEKNLKNLNIRIRDVNSSIDPLRTEMNSIVDEIDQAQTELTHYKSELKKLNDKLKREEAEVAKYKDEHVQKDIEVASQMSQRVKVRKAPEIIQAEIKKLNEQLKKEEELRGDADEIRQLLNALTEKYESAKLQLRQCQIYRKEMKHSLLLRRKNMFHLTEATASMIKLYFATYLHRRSYDGKLHFDFDDCTLDIKVFHQSSSQSNTDSRDLRGLSGGEKSFSTLCFIMALWEAVASPFRCMDEFDVFMDMVNRRISIKMLLEFAKDLPSTQFILLTPQDTSQIEANNFVHIYRMPDTKKVGDGTDR